MRRENLTRQLAAGAIAESHGLQTVEHRQKAGELGVLQDGVQCAAEPLGVTRQRAGVDHTELAAGPVRE